MLERFVAVLVVGLVAGLVVLVVALRAVLPDLDVIAFVPLLEFPLAVVVGLPR